MKILAVDDELLILDALTDCIRKCAPGADIYPFRKPLEALSFAEENKIDVAFLDIRMRGMDGLELGRKLLSRYPELNLIFCTSYDDYISEAFRDIRCNGYITKPVDESQVAKELAHLRLPMQSKSKPSLWVQCLGRFEVFLDDVPISFTNAKTKELFAYLVHACGGICTNQEIIATLWDDDYKHDSYYKKIRKDLVTVLESYGLQDVLVQQRGGLGINRKAIGCDFYMWRDENPGRTPQEYMVQYEWANVPYYEW